MAFVGVVLLALCFAEEIIELEPVQDKYSKLNCGSFTVSGRGTCEGFPYCIWITDTCYNDPCLKWVADAADSDAACGTGNHPLGGSPVTCSLKEWQAGDGLYCTATSQTGFHKYCRFPGLASYPTMDTCTYNYLKSENKTCDPYFCADGAGSTGGDYCGTLASPRNRYVCSELVSENYCKLNPHCYWHSGNCVEDTCTQWSGETANCDTRTNTNNGGKKCVSYNIFDGSSATSGTTKILCVDPDKNKAPNKCYDLGEGGTDATNRVPSGTGICLTYTLPRCAANAECNPQVGTSGPYANYYCGDVNHTASAILLHVPVFLILLLVGVFVF